MGGPFDTVYFQIIVKPQGDIFRPDSDWKPCASPTELPLEVLLPHSSTWLLKAWWPDAKNWLVRKDPDAGKDWKQEEKGATEDEMVGWHHQVSGHGFEQALGVGVGQGGLACCSPWGGKELDTTERLNWTELKGLVIVTWFIRSINIY